MTQIEALKEIARRDGGLLRPAAVVEAARDEDSPLHDAFEWNDGVAAEKYRLDQAQRLIRRFHVVFERDGNKFDVPVFVNLSTDRTEGRENNPYRLSEDLIESPDLMKVAVQDALYQLESVQERYSHLQELNDVWAAINKHNKGRKAK